MGLEFPRSLMGLGKISFEGHPSVSEAIETVATFVQSLHTAGLSLLSSVALFLIVHSSICRVS